MEKNPKTKDTCLLGTAVVEALWGRKTQDAPRTQALTAPDGQKNRGPTKNTNKQKRNRFELLMFLVRVGPRSPRRRRRVWGLPGPSGPTTPRIQTGSR